MSAQTASAFNPADEPVTPVIVKVGGDLGGDGADGSATDVPRTVSISSINPHLMSFQEAVSAPHWASSVSTKAGRIKNVTINDGSNELILDLDVHAASELASVTIAFGTAQLFIKESGVPENCFLLLMSPEVTFKPETEGDWAVSTTSFADKIKSVALMVGDTQRLNYEFQKADATVTIGFDLNPN